MSEGRSLLKLKLGSKARELEEKRRNERNRAMLLLTLDHLMLNGYSESAKMLERESHVKSSQFQIADNVDLEMVFLGYEDYFLEKFGKRPKFYRPNVVQPSSSSRSRGGKGKSGGSGREVKSTGNDRRGRKGRTRGQKQVKKSDEVTYGNVDPPKKPDLKESTTKGLRKRRVNSAKDLSYKNSEKDAKTTEDSNDSSEFLSVTGLGGGKKSKSRKKLAPSMEPKKAVSPVKDSNNAVVDINPGTHEEQTNEYFRNRLMRPLPRYMGEFREYAESIRRDILSTNPEVYWDDIVGLEKAKKLVTEAVVLPIRYPSFFTGVLTPWKGVLLFGPPGTGKTMLAKAVATECKTTFFNISASSIVSKWRGDSEKLVRVLFELARHYAPSTIFLDELDSILSQRKGTEHEASRRMKTELLIQMDGLAKEKNTHVFTLAASNVPWDLDTAVLRRFEKRILVGLPTEEARSCIFKKLVEDRGMGGIDYQSIAKKTDTFSGADIVTVCKEAMMRPVRQILNKLESVDLSKSTEKFDEMVSADSVKVAMEDLDIAISVTKPSGNKFKEQYVKWNKQFGAHTDLL